MKKTVPHLDEMDLEKLATLLSMERGPEAEALYLFNQYEDEALQLAKDCETLFQDEKNKTASDYWGQVYDCLKSLTTKH